MDMQVEATARDRVVIGGSQGALEVLRTLLGALPRDLPAAIMIALHSGLSACSLSSLLQVVPRKEVRFGGAVAAGIGIEP